MAPALTQRTFRVDVAARTFEARRAGFRLRREIHAAAEVLKARAGALGLDQGNNLTDLKQWSHFG